MPRVGCRNSTGNSPGVGNNREGGNSSAISSDGDEDSRGVMEDGEDHAEEDHGDSTHEHGSCGTSSRRSLPPPSTCPFQFRARSRDQKQYQIQGSSSGPSRQSTTYNHRRQIPPVQSHSSRRHQHRQGRRILIQSRDDCGDAGAGSGSRRPVSRASSDNISDQVQQPTQVQGRDEERGGIPESRSADMVEVVEGEEEEGGGGEEEDGEDENGDNGSRVGAGTRVIGGRDSRGATAAAAGAGRRSDTGVAEQRLLEATVGFLCYLV